MRRRHWTLLLVAGVALIAYAAVSMPEDDSCRQSCRAEHAHCVSECGDHSDPIECEAACRRAAEECERSCP
jgi:hypothetical protein